MIACKGAIGDGLASVVITGVLVELFFIIIDK
jgi:hypothetical protein